jgi:hypothetical protein
VIKLGRDIATYPFDTPGRSTQKVFRWDEPDVVVHVDQSARTPYGDNIPAGAIDLPGALSSVGKDGLSGPPGPQQTPSDEPTVLSLPSADTPFETLYHDFDLEAFPFYNFWTPDERTNDRQGKGKRKLTDIPRFIKVSWIPAPDLLGSRERDIPGDINKISNRPIQFGTEAQKPGAFLVKGISFSPAHLQPVNFSQAKNYISNGHVGPGVLEAIVDMPLHNTGLDTYKTHAQAAPEQNMDEDMFLVHPDLDGVSPQELQGQLHQLTNGTLAAGKLASSPISPNASVTRDEMVSGKFSITRPPYVGGTLQVHSVHASSPTLSLVGVTADTQTEAERFDPVLDLADKVRLPDNVNSIEQSSQIKVKFANPAIGGIVEEGKVNLMTRPEHVESMMAVAQNIGRLETLEQSGFRHIERDSTIPSFPAPPGLKPLEYIGYVLEKYRRNATGVFEKVEEIDLASRDYDYYIDSKITYGDVYRYRIRAILRWTRPMNVGVNGEDPLTIQRNGSQTLPLSPFLSSYFGSEWSKKWVYGMVIDAEPPPPPDELTVRPDSARKRIMVTFRICENPQRDIYKMRLFRKIQSNQGEDLTGWNQVKEVSGDNPDEAIDFSPKNVLYFDTDVEFNDYRYVYTCQSISRHDEASTFSDQLAARLNSDWQVFGEFPVMFVSCAGVRPEYFGAFSVFPHRRTRTEIISTDEPSTSEDKRFKVTLGGREKVGNSMMQPVRYYVRVESLDTGEKRDFPLDITYNNGKPMVRTLTVGAIVPQHGIVDTPASSLPSWVKAAKDGHTTSIGRDVTPTMRPDRGTRGR